MNTLVRLTENKEIIYASFILRKNGLEPVETPDFEQWLECGEFINKAKGSVHFWIGDWLNYGEQQWGEKYLDALEKTNYEYQTLRDDKWVAARVELSRRRDNLSFDHHVTVASLDPEEQDVLLKEADTKQLDSKEFRRYVAQRELGYKTEPSETTPTITSIINSNNLFIEQLGKIDLEKYTSEEKNNLKSNLVKIADIVNQLLEAI